MEGSMRVTSSIRVLALVLLCGTPAVAQRASRDPSAASDEWLERCRDQGRRNDDRERYCEVRERRLRSARQLDVDGQQNGSVVVHGWDRSEVLVLARIQTDGNDLS